MGLKRGPREKYYRRFPEGVQKEEIQKRRQARSQPGEKETPNIMLRDKPTDKVQSGSSSGAPAAVLAFRR